MRNSVSRLLFIAAAASAGLGIHASALAVDGVILIDQARVAAAGGFPYVIAQPGSYRLASNLVVPSPNTTAIRIVDVRNVELDLNGFSIIGPVNCTIAPTAGNAISCSGTGGGIGILAAVTEKSDSGPQGTIHIKNGSVQGMGSHGIWADGKGPVVVDNITVQSNGGRGIVAAGYNSRLDRISANENGGDGIFFHYGTLTNSISTSNGGNGIYVFSGMLANNYTIFNRGYGVAGTAGAASNNFFSGFLGPINPGLTLTQLAKNFCDSASPICP